MCWNLWKLSAPRYKRAVSGVTGQCNDCLARWQPHGSEPMLFATYYRNISSLSANISFIWTLISSSSCLCPPKNALQKINARELVQWKPFQALNDAEDDAVIYCRCGLPNYLFSRAVCILFLTLSFYFILVSISGAYLLSWKHKKVLLMTTSKGKYCPRKSSFYVFIFAVG